LEPALELERVQGQELEPVRELGRVLEPVLVLVLHNR